MCCRYSLVPETSDDAAKRFLRLMERDYPGQYKLGEIFPGDSAPALLGAGGRLRHAPAVFGYPGFEKGRLLLNARAETAARKPTFAESLRERRAVLPANGFFEWGRDERKTKYLFTPEIPGTLYLCGLWQVFDGVCRFVILTRKANACMEEIHDRMPVIAAAGEVRAYLTDLAAALEIIGGSDPRLTRRAV